MLNLFNCKGAPAMTESSSGREVTVKTIAFIEKNAKNPSSSNIIDSKKQQVIAAIGQVVVSHVACND